MEQDSSPRPPTLNFLGPFQRSRLLKSSRKIEYILGATPHVLESSDDVPHRSFDLVDGHGALPDGKHGKYRRFKLKKRQGHHSTRLHLSPVSPPTDDSLTNDTSDLPSPLPLTVSIPHPPARLLTLPEPPDYHDGTITSPDRLQRKQMAKLTRVLGENIPPELVRFQNTRNAHPLHSDPTPTTSCSRQRLGGGDSITRRPRRSGRRSSSLDSPLPDHQPRPATSPPPPPLPNLALATSPSPPPPPLPAKSPRRSHSSKGKERTSPKGLSTSSTPPGSLEESQRSNGSSSGSGRSPPQSITYPLLTSEQRVEARWDGEWNIKDTEMRKMALRNLKSR